MQFPPDIQQKMYLLKKISAKRMKIKPKRGKNTSRTNFYFLFFFLQDIRSLAIFFFFQKYKSACKPSFSPLKIKKYRIYLLFLSLFWFKASQTLNKSFWKRKEWLCYTQSNQITQSKHQSHPFLIPNFNFLSNCRGMLLRNLPFFWSRNLAKSFLLFLFCSFLRFFLWQLKLKKAQIILLKQLIHQREENHWLFTTMFLRLQRNCLFGLPTSLLWVDEVPPLFFVMFTFLYFNRKKKGENEKLQTHNPTINTFLFMNLKPLYNCIFLSFFFITTWRLSCYLYLSLYLLFLVELL